MGIDGEEGAGRLQATLPSASWFGSSGGSLPPQALAPFPADAWSPLPGALLGPHPGSGPCPHCIRVMRAVCQFSWGLLRFRGTQSRREGPVLSSRPLLAPLAPGHPGSPEHCPHTHPAPPAEPSGPGRRRWGAQVSLSEGPRCRWCLSYGPTGGSPWEAPLCPAGDDPDASCLHRPDLLAPVTTPRHRSGNVV